MLRLYRYILGYCVKYSLCSLVMTLLIVSAYCSIFVMSRMQDQGDVLSVLKAIFDMMPYLTYLVFPVCLIVSLVFVIDVLRLRRYWVALYSFGQTFNDVLSCLARFGCIALLLVIGTLDWLDFSHKPQIDEVNANKSLESSSIWLTHKDELVLLSQIKAADQIGKVEIVKLNNHEFSGIKRWENLEFQDNQWVMESSMDADALIKPEQIQWLNPSLLRLLLTDPKYLSMHDLMIINHMPNLKFKEMAMYHSAMYARLYYPLNALLSFWVALVLALSAAPASGVLRRLLVPIMSSLSILMILQNGLPIFPSFVTSDHQVPLFYICILLILQCWSLRLNKRLRWV